MIKPAERFLPDDGCHSAPFDNPSSKVSYDIWDWDQLRMIKASATAKLFPFVDDNVDPQRAVLVPFADYLSPKVTGATFDGDGQLVGLSTDPDDDDTPFVGYLPFSTVKSLDGCRTIRYSELQELDRLGPGVDLSSYIDESGVPQKAAFKFNPFNKIRKVRWNWNELHVLKHLPPHRNLMTLDRVVLEDVESRIIGFTTKFIPGGTFDDPGKPFRFEWLRQLTQAVDFLNLELGIMHQDIAPRNLLVDPETNDLVLFDFDWVSCGNRDLMKGRDDVTCVIFTLYEIITNDQSFPVWNRNRDAVQSQTEWPCKRELDCEVSKFREFLNEWVATREADETASMEQYLNAPSKLFWPDIAAPHEPKEMVASRDPNPYWLTGPYYRRNAVEEGYYCFRWERPPQSRLLKKPDGSAATTDGKEAVSNSVN